MARTARVAPGGWFFHVLNRSNGGGRLFESSTCYREFVCLVAEAAARDAMRIVAYCVMPNHWHMLLWPRTDADLARFVHRVSMRHALRHHARHRTTGRGHIYQARYKSFPVRDDAHLLTVCRYIERNPLRAGLVERAESWPWSSARAHVQASGRMGRNGAVVESRLVADEIALDSLPLPLPDRWDRDLNGESATASEEAVRTSVRTGVPFGDEDWTVQSAARLGLPDKPKKGGRPRKVVR